VAFARCFGYPVTWFFLPPPPGVAGMPRRADTGETPRQYGRRLNTLLTQVFGSYDQVDELQARVAVYAGELSARTLDDARDIVSETSGVLLSGGPFGTDELQRWRQALLGVAEGLGVLEAEARRQASVALAGAFRAHDAAEASKDFDLRTIDLGLDPPSGRKRSAERARGIEFEH